MLPCSTGTVLDTPWSPSKDIFKTSVYSSKVMVENYFFFIIQMVGWTPFFPPTWCYKERYMLLNPAPGCLVCIVSGRAPDLQFSQGRLFFFFILLFHITLVAVVHRVPPTWYECFWHMCSRPGPSTRSTHFVHSLGPASCWALPETRWASPNGHIRNRKHSEAKTRHSLI